MIRKLTKSKNSTEAMKKNKVLENVRGGGVSTSPIDVLHDLLCSQYCEKFCGTKPGSDGAMWSGNSDYR